MDTEPRVLSDSDIAVLDLLEGARTAERQQIIRDARRYQEKLEEEAAGVELVACVWDSIERLKAVEKDINERRSAFYQTRQGIKKQAELIVAQQPHTQPEMARTMARLMAKRRTMYVDQHYRTDSQYPLVHALDTEWIEGYGVRQGWRLIKLSGNPLHGGYSIVNELHTDNDHREAAEYYIHKGFEPQDTRVEAADGSAVTDEGMYFAMGIIEATIRQFEQRREFWDQSPRKIRRAWDNSLK